MVEDMRPASGGGGYRLSHDPEIVGLRVQADGGGWVPGTQFGSRESFEGTLTGRRMEQGDPPWRWLELGNLTDAPEDFPQAFVWCEESYVFLVDDDGRPEA